MDIGLCVPQLGEHVTADLIHDFAVRAEELGFGSLWVQDHFLYALQQEGQYGGTATAQPDAYRSVWAPTELLAALATWTSTVTIGSSILVGGNHWPVQLASRLATIDQLSRGRLTVGFGVGWSHEEHLAVGVDPRTRGRRMEEFIPALLACWGDDPVAFEGEFFSIPPSVIRPKPYQRPHPPLMSGMWSEAGLRRTATHFDLWNPGSMPIAQVVETLDRINQQRPAGREPVNAVYRVALERTSGERMTIEQVADRAVEARDAGLEGLIIETNFCSDIDGADAWMSKLEQLQVVVDVVAS